MSRIALLGAIALIASSTTAAAITANWTDWLGSTSTSATGEVVVGMDTVGITLSHDAALYAVQNGTMGGPIGLIDYWIDLGYTQGLINRPPAAELVAFGFGGTVTIDFDQTVRDIFIAFTSWNGNTVQFSAPFSIVSVGQGFWGNGSFVVNPDSDGFIGSGEVHGVLRFAGDFDQLTFTHTTEFWHGLTIGFERVSDPGDIVPAPAALALFGLGVAALGFARRR